MVISIAEFLEKVSKLKNIKEKVNALQANDSVVLRIIMRCCYDPNVQWLLPTGKPPYKPNELVDQEHVLIKDCEKLQYYLKGYGDNLAPAKREMMFIELLERVAPIDAEMLCQIKDKQQFKGISLQTVKEAFPGLISE